MTPANTPFYLDKAWYMAVLTPLCVLAATKLEFQLSPEALAIIIVPVVAYIIATKTKAASNTNALINNGHFDAPPAPRAEPSPEPSKVPPSAASIVLVALALGFGSLALGGCAHFDGKAFERKVISCGEKAVADQLTPDLIKQVGGALAGDSVNWDSNLDRLIASAGDAAICALQALISTLESGGGGAGIEPAALLPATPGAPDRPTLLLRAYSYRESRHLGTR